MIGQTGAILEELEKRSKDTQRRRWALVVESELDLSDGDINETMKHPGLETLFHEVYEAWQNNTDTWEEYDSLIGREEALDEACQVVRDVIAYGYDAFDPSHPRFKTGSPSH